LAKREQCQRVNPKLLRFETKLDTMERGEGGGLGNATELDKGVTKTGTRIQLKHE